ncbi:hypothetical protein [Massilia aquatica]|uniref:Uncharacterized protein n=1 Tax=Massilia aquatica TaxID=2609000 RepID=A0ABX0M3R5_9BURK|nr:hypothetical protein [Massilia aquatica]NHZ38872.1 hypothetical protein [Massilia aquatica]
MLNSSPHGEKPNSTNCLTAIKAWTDTVPVAKKEATGFGDLKLTKADNRHQAAFFRPLHHCVLYERQWWGYLRVCRFPLSPVRQPRHLLLTPFGDGLRGLTTDEETIMFSTTTSQHSPSSVGTLSVEQLFQTAFYNGRTPRSQEYKAGARMALEHRIERKDFDMPYQAGTAAADAYFAGIEEGKTIWRAAVAKIGGAA